MTIKSGKNIFPSPVGGVVQLCTSKYNNNNNNIVFFNPTEAATGGAVRGSGGLVDKEADMSWKVARPSPPTVKLPQRCSELLWKIN